MRKYQSHVVKRQVRTQAMTRDGQFIGKVYSLPRPAACDSCDFVCASMDYARAICDEATQRGYHADWGRAANCNKWRVEVFEIERVAFSDILSVAGRAVPLSA